MPLNGFFTELLAELLAEHLSGLLADPWLKIQSGGLVGLAFDAIE